MTTTRVTTSVRYEATGKITVWRLSDTPAGGTTSGPGGVAFAVDVELGNLPSVGLKPGDPPELEIGELEELTPGAIGKVRAIRVRQSDRLSRSTVHECVAIAIGRIVDAELKATGATFFERALGGTRARAKMTSPVNRALDLAAEAFGGAVVP